MAGRVSARWVGTPISSLSSIPNGNKRCSWAWAWTTARWSRIRASLDFTGEISRAPDRMASSRTTAATEAAATPDDVVVQYVVLRRDLIDTWPMGSVVTQGCHASVAAIWSHKDDPHTLHYCGTSNLDSMHKLEFHVTGWSASMKPNRRLEISSDLLLFLVTLEVKGETQMLNLSEKLTAGGIAHKLWIEQPENIPTCLATKPYPKSMVSSYFKRLKLCK